MRKRFDGERGTVLLLEHDSDCLRGNPLGDPTRRQLPVYLPAGYERDASRRYPVLFSLAGFTGSGPGQIAWKNFGESHPERLDRLIHARAIPPVIVVFPDCFTALGGNQYIDSSAMGAYGSHLADELVPFIDSRLRTLPGRDHRGILGKSSGGYGALIQGMRRPEVWGAVGCHSGDMYFEFCYLRELPKCLDVIARHEHSVAGFIDEFHRKPKPSADEVGALIFIAMAASYDPDPSVKPLGFRLPCDLRTGELDLESWRRWQRHDPIRMLGNGATGEYAEALRGLRALYIDCGSRDQFALHYGARILSRELHAAGVKHVYEEFDDDHSGVDYRLDRSLPILCEALRGR